MAVVLLLLGPPAGNLCWGQPGCWDAQTSALCTPQTRAQIVATSSLPSSPLPLTPLRCLVIGSGQKWVRLGSTRPGSPKDWAGSCLLPEWTSPPPSPAWPHWSQTHLRGPSSKAPQPPPDTAVAQPCASPQLTSNSNSCHMWSSVLSVPLILKALWWRCCFSLHLWVKKQK